MRTQAQAAVIFDRVRVGKNVTAEQHELFASFLMVFFGRLEALSAYLDLLEQEHSLPRMVLYNLNPADNYVLATASGSFNDCMTPGKVQFGCGWWFLDQKEGMEWQLNALSNTGLLSRFIHVVPAS